MENHLNIPLDSKNIHFKPIELYSFSRDASYYRLVPEAVITPKTIEEIAVLFNWCKKEKKSITFRAAGTSLSGQAITNSILVDLSKNWNKINIIEEGQFVRTEPGIIGGMVNEMLKPYKRRIGPDPASINACMIGGIIANNSSGMCSGTALNPYNTILSLKYLLPNGLFIDSAKKDSNIILKEECPEIFENLLQLKNGIENNYTLKKKILSKYRIKNTIGYSLNAFLDYSSPLDILTRLMIGSEGTLSFIAESVFKTFPIYPHKFTGLLFFPDIKSACLSIMPLKNAGAVVLELIDYISLRSVENRPGAPDIIKSLTIGSSALLFEFQRENKSEIINDKSNTEKIASALNLLCKPFLTEDEKRRNQLWTIRQGLLTSLSAQKKTGEAVIIEDVAFDIEDLPDAILSLRNLFNKHGFNNSGIYGHGIDGNLHFIITCNLNSKESVVKLGRFFDELAEMVVVKFNGSLKAEHGTGRNMAPYVEKEWGSDAYEIMKQIKGIIDPANILNPGVIINSDARIHLKNIKSYPKIESYVDNCIECGFCESKCPSRDLTLTPRKRIALRREMLLLKNDLPKIYYSILQDYQYYGIDTCALDGLCETACPVGINTGELIKNLRIEELSNISKKIAFVISNYFTFFEFIIKLAIKSGHTLNTIFGKKTTFKLSQFIDKIFIKHKFPKWNNYLTYPAKLQNTSKIHSQAVYFPCCVSRMLGKPATQNNDSIIKTILTVAKRASFKLWLPPDCSNYCCGMMFSSKGYTEAFRNILNKTVNKMWEWSDEGRLPIILDSSSCAYTLRNSKDYLEIKTLEKYNNMIFLDSIEFINDYLLPKLKIRKKLNEVILHPTCSAVKLNIVEKMKHIANFCSDNVIIPINTGCCGFAGDRGLLFPELTISATKHECEEILEINTEHCYSSNIPCEISMSSATKKVYRSMIYLVDEATK